MQTICNICQLNPQSKIKCLGANTSHYDYVVALTGNPNTGKSTIFNTLTGLKQHTGNWSGKTVTRAEGGFSYENKNFKLIDLPGTYSLLSSSSDEEIARNFILFSKPDVTLIIADATRLERNLNLVLQILEITSQTVLCVNLLDEAKRHGITIDLRTLSRKLGIPVVGTSARKREGILQLVQTLWEVANGVIHPQPRHIQNLPKNIENQIEHLQTEIKKQYPHLPNSRWVAMRLLEGDPFVIEALEKDFFKR